MANNILTRPQYNRLHAMYVRLLLKRACFAVLRARGLIVCPSFYLNICKLATLVLVIRLALAFINSLNAKYHCFIGWPRSY